MYWVKVTKPQYNEAQAYNEQIGEVVGHWGPDNSENGRNGLMVRFADGEVIGLTEEEVTEVSPPPSSPA